MLEEEDDAPRPGICSCFVCTRSEFPEKDLQGGAPGGGVMYYAGRMVSSHL